MEQVPEGDVVALREKVKNLTAFQCSRGKWGESLAEIVAEYVATTPNPTQCLERVEMLCMRLKIIADKAAQLRRDGHDVAVSELFDVLKYPEKRLPWEVTAPCPKTTITLFMLDPVRTLAIIDFLVRGRFKDLYRADLTLENATGTVKTLLEQFPRLVLECSSRIDCEWFGFDIREAYDLWVNPLRGAVVECLGKFPSRKLSLGYTQYDSSRGMFDVWCCCYVAHAPAKAVLECFSRDQQKVLATWQIDVPENLVDSPYFGMFGFHPENEHTEWRKVAPDFTSVGTAHGLGVIRYCGSDKRLTEEINRTHAGWKNNPPALRFQLL